MILQNIDKATYRKHLNIVIASTIIASLVIALGTSTILIQLVGNESGSNFVLNLIGVVLAGVTIVSVLYRIRTTPFMFEVVYVWRLKQELNAIYRQSSKIKPALESNNINALIITYYNLNGSIQLYELDDNDLTLESLRNDLSELEAKLESLELNVKTEDYHRDLLKQLSA